MAAVNVATKTGVVTMKVAQISKPKAGFDIVEREIPQPGAGHVRIKAQACGVKGPVDAARMDAGGT